MLLNLQGDVATVGTPPTAALRGRLAIVERPVDRPPTAWLVGGTSTRQNDVVLANPVDSYVGTLESVSSAWDGAAENAFVTTAKLPAGEALAGRWMIVNHGPSADEGYRIARIEHRGGKSVVILADDPGLRMTRTTTEEIFFPRRKWTGPNRFRILTQTASPAP
ncbi:MAG: hypothetical protein QM775_09795 [Pirellulales bacterium]